MDRLLYLALCCLPLALACPDERDQQAAPPGRFVAVQGKRATDAAKKFCEKSFPSSGANALAFAAPAERQPPGAAAPAPAAPGWRWINLWATWCTPCVEEIPLLGRWRDGLAKDGVAVALELWSVDEDEEALRTALTKPLPGQVHWMRSFEELSPFLKGLGLADDAALPIHVLVNPAGQVRCVRVGAVHDEDYGAIKAILSES